MRIVFDFESRAITVSRRIPRRMYIGGVSFFIASSEERNESLLSFRPSDDATKV